MTDLVSKLNQLKLKRREAEQQFADAEKLIGEIQRHDAALRKANRTGELAENHQKMQAARKQRRAAEEQLANLKREIYRVARNITGIEFEQHRVARDDVWQGWQVHSAAGPRWRQARMIQLIESPPRGANDEP